MPSAAPSSRRASRCRAGATEVLLNRLHGHEQRLRDLLSFRIPALQLVELALVAVIDGTVAAALPARRAERLNVPEALQYE